MNKWQRIIIVGCVAALAGIAGWVSYWHTVRVVSDAGEAWMTAHIIGFTADGLMAVCGQLVWSRRAARSKRWPAWLGFATGGSAMLAANWMAARPTLVSHVIALWPAVALIVAMVVLENAFVKVPPARRRTPAKKAPVKAPVRKRAARTRAEVVTA